MADPRATPAAEPEPWTTGVRAVLDPFVTYFAARMKSGDLEECRRKAKVSEAVGELFEEALDQICPDEPDEPDEAAQS